MFQENSFCVESPLAMNAKDYGHWRAWKLGLLEVDCFVSVANEGDLPQKERDAISEAVAAHHFVVLQGDENWQGVCRQLGLVHWVDNPGAGSDGVTEIAVADDVVRQRYIPYSDRALGWHTDGYYNDAENSVRSFALYCERAAARGGENRLIDPELIYILLRDENPLWVEALCHPEAFVIPENRVDGTLIREAFCGAVFETDTVTGRLYMRYTQRTRHIVWRDDVLLREALAFLNHILEGVHPWIRDIRLASGQLLVCNNVLHCRSAFMDEGDGRLLYRMRFKDQIRESLIKK